MAASRWSRWSPWGRRRCWQPCRRPDVALEDSAIRAAQRHLWETTRVVAEPGGATALAALLSGSYVPEPGERVAVVACGANTDPGMVAR